MSSGFVHLRVHTEFSLVDSVVRVRELVERAVQLGMPAVAVTDESNLFAMVKFYRAALKHGVKPIVGADLWIGDGGENASSRLTLLCQSLEGYRNLSRLISRGFLEGGERGRALLQRGWLTADTVTGLIALSGGCDGDVGRALLAGREDQAEDLLGEWLALFGDRYYLEVCRTRRRDDETHLAATVKLAAGRSVPVVAGNDVRFLEAGDFEAHEARVCIHEGRTLDDPGRPRRFSEQQYFKSADEMARLFADLPEALANSVEIARRCSLQLSLGKPVLPAFPLAEGKSEAGYLEQAANSGLEERLAAGAPGGSEEEYRQRLKVELDVICQMGFAGYFLIVADFIGWARRNDIPVGPGRGSGAGSLVAYALRITDIDPLEHELLFDRFLNPERVSMPDFDVDFCMDGRDRVIEYVAERYGRERVSQIITFGTMAARAVVRDVGRVLGHPYGFVDRIAKLIPFEIGMTLEKALEQEPELARVHGEEEEVRALFDLARRLEGLARNAGKHAGGVVIAPTPLTDFTPLYREDRGANAVTHFDKDDVEAVGLVKFDFLGLRTLTIIDRAMAIVNAERSKTGEEALDINAIARDDAVTFELLKACDTTAVFQLESRGMRDLIRRLQPDSFEDIVALGALFRPGPLQSGMVDDFVERKHGRHTAPADYLHPRLRSVLEPTYGVILYQEQVMQIAQVLAGYTLGGADLLRRAMGKKKPEEMAKQRAIFLAGARERGVEEAQASHIFDLMEKFAGYGFNKSHSAAYALLTYQTAWLKAHYPAAFMAAVMSSDMDNTDKLVVLKDDCQRPRRHAGALLRLELLVPDVNESQFAFTVAAASRIRYGLGAIKGVGHGAVAALIAEREANGPFTDLFDLCKRLDLHRVNRRCLEAMIRAGALDALGPNRATLMEMLPDAVKAAEQSQQAAEAGQSDLFGAALAAPTAGADASASSVTLRPEWSERDRLAAERESLGLYLTGHPFDQYREHCRHFTTAGLGSLAGGGGETRPAGNAYAAPRREVVAAGLVVEAKRRGPRVTLTLDDGTGRLEATLFDEVYQRHRDLAVKDSVIAVEGTLRYDEFIESWRVAVQRLVDVDEMIENHARRLLIEWADPGEGRQFVESLKDTLRPFRRGACDVLVEYVGAEARARVHLGEEWTVRPTRELREQLTALVGEGHVRLLYGQRGGDRPPTM